jgi:hypothetical protein
MAMPEPIRTPDEQLRSLGLDWERLEKLAKRALNDAKRQRKSRLDEGRDRAAIDYLFDVGLVWAYRYDEAKANGVSFATSVYRRMVMRYPDYLRYGDCAGDPRLGTPLTLVFVDEMPDGATIDKESFRQLVEQVSGGLSTGALWTLANIAEPRAVEGLRLREIADRHGLTLAQAERLLAQLGAEMDYTPSPLQPDISVSVFSVMDEGSVAA